jgi:hypothetical protein
MVPLLVSVTLVETTAIPSSGDSSVMLGLLDPLHYTELQSSASYSLPWKQPESTPQHELSKNTRCSFAKTASLNSLLWLENEASTSNSEPTLQVLVSAAHDEKTIVPSSEGSGVLSTWPVRSPFIFSNHLPLSESRSARPHSPRTQPLRTEDSSLGSERLRMTPCCSK